LHPATRAVSRDLGVADKHVAGLLKERSLSRAMNSGLQSQKRPTLQLLDTFDEVVEALGGKAEVGILCDQNTAAVCNWKRRRSRFPTKFYIVMLDELHARGYHAPFDLWGFVSRPRE
jgi:hypothetical protein